MLSPFQVDSTREKGYFAENTLAGSRMRTNIADLGAAITVVTKQQMDDTASLDVNDIFRYELGTEGSTTYTPDVRNGNRPDGVFESIAGGNIGGALTASTNATANRVRGLGSPSFALNYYQTLPQIPFDSYNTASVEINRGPNSMLFGMGSPAGIVNQSTAQAQINKNNAQVQIRVDDRGSERASFSFNKSLIDGKLAIYGALLYNDQQFERKPSYDITRRQYGAITYKPFKKTTLRATIEGYDNDNRRPNTLAPIDGVSEWRNATLPNGKFVGMPVYDAKTHKFISLATGEEISMLVGSQNSYMADALRNYIEQREDFDGTKWNAEKTQYNGISIFGGNAISDINSILYVPGMATYNARTIMQVSNGNLQRWFQPLGGNRPATGHWSEPAATRYPFSTTAGDANYVYDNQVWTDIYDWWQVENSPYSMAINEPYFGQKLYPGVTDRSIYDWKKVNLLTMNFGSQRNTNYNVEIEQEIIPGLLHFSAGWFRQDFDSLQSYTVGQLNTTTLRVDTNIYNSDGTLNPFFGQPYVQDDAAIDRIESSATVDQYRAMLAYTPDFTKNRNWTRWLGRHQIMGLASYLDHEQTGLRRRLGFGYGSTEGEYRYTANPTVAGWKRQSNATIRRHFYLSDIAGGPSAGVVTQASGGLDASVLDASVAVYDYAQNQFKEVDMTMIWNVSDIETAKSARKLTSYSAGWTGYLWEDRIITTAGVRRDINRTRNTDIAKPADISQSAWDQIYYVDGYYQYGEIFKRWNNWSRLSGVTNTAGAVVKPFLNWEPIAKRAGDSLFWEFVENLGFSYNKSDNFDAPAATYVDPFGTVLPKPQGEGKDYGVQFSLFKNKLFARVNWFESNNDNVPYLGALERVIYHIDTTAYRGWLEHIYMLNDGGDPSTTNWTYPWTAGSSGADQNKVNAMREWVGEKWGLNNDYDYYNHLGGAVRGTTSAEAKGVEVSVNYNPLPNWTIKATASKVTTTNTNINKEYEEWFALRKPVWDAARAVDFLNATGLATLNRLGGVSSYRVSDDPNSEARGNIEYFWSSVNFRNANNATTITQNSNVGWTTVENYYKAVLVPNAILQKDMEGQQAMGQRKYNFTLVTNYAFDRGLLKGWAVGGAQRWTDKAIIGYYGKSSGNNGTTLDISDISRPIYDDATWYTDLWISYTHKILNDKVRMKLQLNVADLFQDGELKPMRADWLGRPYAYRIIDSRQFILTATFDF
jgi:hypothetical protein